MESKTRRERFFFFLHYALPCLKAQKPCYNPEWSRQLLLSKGRDISVRDRILMLYLFPEVLVVLPVDTGASFHLFPPENDTKDDL